jgi:hypothetical protein
VGGLLSGGLAPQVVKEEGAFCLLTGPTPFQARRAIVQLI